MWACDAPGVRPLKITRLAARSASLAALALIAAAAGVLPPAIADGVSANWSGYVASPRAGGGSPFSSVSASWKQPNAACSAGRETYSAVWVGLGGYRAHARALEQIGTNADCTRGGRASYTSWYELLPAAPVNLALEVRPGDQMVASVTVRDHGVTLRVRDLSTGARFSTTRRIAPIDTSSAEWIVEAPSRCMNSDSCETLPLTDFGDVAFSTATATASAHTGTITDPDWTATALELQQSAVTGIAGQAGTRAGPQQSLALAVPSTSSGATGAFSVGWSEQAVQDERAEAPSLPGFGGGPP
jgi:hypothetical protein